MESFSSMRATTLQDYIFAISILHKRYKLKPPERSWYQQNYMTWPGWIHPFVYPIYIKSNRSLGVCSSRKLPIGLAARTIESFCISGLFPCARLVLIQLDSFSKQGCNVGDWIFRAKGGATLNWKDHQCIEEPPLHDRHGNQKRTREPNSC